MKHKNLIDSFNSANSTFSTNAVEPNEVTLSGAEVVRLSESQKSLNRLKRYKEEKEIEKQKALARLHNREYNPKDPSQERLKKYDPNKFNDARGKMNLYWTEFQETFGYIASAWRFTREDYKRFWLQSLGASKEEIANITGYSIEPIERWQKSIQRKITHNDNPAKWIEQKALAGIQLSGTSPELDTNKRESMERIKKFNEAKEELRRLEEKAGIVHHDN
jgi:hypothetical protein